MLAQAEAADTAAETRDRAAEARDAATDRHEQAAGSGDGTGCHDRAASSLDQAHSGRDRDLATKHRADLLASHDRAS